MLKELTVITDGQTREKIICKDNKINFERDVFIGSIHESLRQLNNHSWGDEMVEQIGAVPGSNQRKFIIQSIKFGLTIGKARK